MYYAEYYDGHCIMTVECATVEQARAALRGQDWWTIYNADWRVVAQS